MTEQRFYLFSKYHSGGKDYALWWRPESAGYTSDLRRAGLYTEAEARTRADSEGRTYAIPAELPWGEGMTMVVMDTNQARALCDSVVAEAQTTRAAGVAAKPLSKEELDALRARPNGPEVSRLLATLDAAREGEAAAQMLAYRQQAVLHRIGNAPVYGRPEDAAVVCVDLIDQAREACGMPGRVSGLVDTTGRANDLVTAVGPLRAAREYYEASRAWFAREHVHENDDCDHCRDLNGRLAAAGERLCDAWGRILHGSKEPPPAPREAVSIEHTLPAVARIEMAIARAASVGMELASWEKYVPSALDGPTAEMMGDWAERSREIVAILGSFFEGGVASETGAELFAAHAHAAAAPTVEERRKLVESLKAIWASAAADEPSAEPSEVERLSLREALPLPAHLRARGPAGSNPGDDFVDWKMAADARAAGRSGAPAKPEAPSAAARLLTRGSRTLDSCACIGWARDPVAGHDTLSNHHPDCDDYEPSSPEQRARRLAERLDLHSGDHPRVWAEDVEKAIAYAIGNADTIAREHCARLARAAAKRLSAAAEASESPRRERMRSSAEHLGALASKILASKIEKR